MGGKFKIKFENFNVNTFHDSLMFSRNFDKSPNHSFTTPTTMRCGTRRKPRHRRSSSSSRPWRQQRPVRLPLPSCRRMSRGRLVSACQTEVEDVKAVAKVVTQWTGVVAERPMTNPGSYPPNRCTFPPPRFQKYPKSRFKNPSNSTPQKHSKRWKHHQLHATKQ